MSVEPERRLLTEAEAAAFLGVARITLRKARLCGKQTNRLESPPFVRAGRRCIRYDVRDLENWIARHKQGQTADNTFYNNATR